MAEDASVREEYFDNVPIGVEVESIEQLDGQMDPVVPPWDPTDIRVGTKQFSLRNILDLIDEGDLELAPDFQRNRVWKNHQKSSLIESILLQIPLPAFYFAEDSNGMMRVVDGLQRLSTVHGFVRGGSESFGLTGLEYLRDLDHKNFRQLPTAMQRRINNAQIVVHVIDPTTPPRVKYDIFKRINTGGTPLNAQEIRHCMSSDRSRNFLKECAHLPEFNLATGSVLRDHIRMNDREMVLRFCAFWLQGVDGYAKEGSMDAYLEATTAALDDPERISDEQLEELHSAFSTAMKNAAEVFGEHAFRKWSIGTVGRNPINRPLFECWSSVLGRYEQADLALRQGRIVAAARDLMTNDKDYVEAITQSTGDLRKVRRRFELTERAAEAGR